MKEAKEALSAYILADIGKAVRGLEYMLEDDDRTNGEVETLQASIDVFKEIADFIRQSLTTSCPSIK